MQIDTSNGLPGRASTKARNPAEPANARGPRAGRGRAATDRKAEMEGREVKLDGGCE